MQIKKGGLYIAGLSPEMVAAIIGRQSKHRLPTHIPVGGQGGLQSEHLTPESLLAVDQALAVSFGMKLEAESAAVLNQQTDMSM